MIGSAHHSHVQHLFCVLFHPFTPNLLLHNQQNHCHQRFIVIIVISIVVIIIIIISFCVWLFIVTTAPGWCDAGWTGNQVVAGVLLQTTRRLVTHACNQRFDKFTTVCTEQQVVYDADTGQAVVVAKSSGGSAPYGVDAVFLADSSAYDATTVVGEHLCPESNKARCRESGQLLLSMHAACCFFPVLCLDSQKHNSLPKQQHRHKDLEVP